MSLWRRQHGDAVSPVVCALVGMGGLAVAVIPDR
jgi:hypothetical protein